MKNDKASGPNSVHAEILKMLCETDSQFRVPLFNTIYDCCELPQKWSNPLFVLITMKPHERSCDQYGLISVITTITKVFMKVIHNGMYTKCESKTGKNQLSFRGSFGT